MSPPSPPLPEPPGPFPVTGEVWLGRLRIEAALADNRWQVTDLRTGATHLLVALSPERIRRLDEAGRLALEEPFIHPPIPGLLPHLRLEGGWPEYHALAGFSDLLRSPSLAGLPRPLSVDPRLALQWVFGVGSALARLQAEGLRAHGAVAPSVVWAAADGATLLGGYPFGPWAAAAEDEAFLSPQRREGLPVDPADDVYGLASLTHFVLTGGTPGAPAEPGRGETALDTLRQRAGLPPSGWSKGWDDVVFAAMSRQPSLRPGSVAEFLERLSRATGFSAPPAPPGRREIGLRRLGSLRRPASWRRGPRGEPHPAAPIPTAPGRFNPLEALAQLGRERDELAVRRGELERRAEALGRDLSEAEKRREQIVRLGQELDQLQAETNEARAALQRDSEEVRAGKLKLETDRVALEKERARNEEALRKDRLELERLRETTDAQKAANETQAGALRRLEERLASRGTELDLRQRVVAEAEQRLQNERAELVAQRTAEAAKAAPTETPGAAPAPTPEPPPPGDPLAEARLVLRAETAERERARLEQELAETRNRAEAQRDERAGLEERVRSLTQREEEFTRRLAELEAAAKVRDTEAAALADARRKLDERQAQLDAAKTGLEAEKRAFEEAKQRAVKEKDKEKEKRRKPEPVPPASPSPDGTPRPATPSRMPLLATAGVAALICLVLGFLLVRSSSENTRLREAARPPPPRPAVLVVASDPAGAEVTVPGLPSQRTPARFDGLAAGPVTVRIAKEGYRAVEQTVSVAAGETVLAPLALLNPVAAPAGAGTGWLYVRTQPAGAQVSLPGQPPAPSPVLLREVPAGTARVSVRLDGYIPVDRSVAVKAGEDTILDVALQVAPPPPRVGAVSITAEPADAEIQLGPSAPQRSPATFRDLAPGRVRLSVRREGYEPVEQEVEVRAGETTSVPRITLRPKPAPARPVVTLPAEVTLAAGAVELRLVRVDPGEVEFGDATRGTATVRLSRPVLMAVNEVTQAAYAAVMGENPSALKERRTPGGPRTIFEEVTVMRMEGGRQVPVKERRPKVVAGEEEVVPLPDNPVENVTWEEAMEFCARLTRSAQAQGRLPAGTVVRLPTEAEWQRARAGATWTAAGRAGLERAAWTAENAADGHRAVRTRAATSIGIHDLDGNVAEWCLDAWSTVVPPAGAADWLVLDPRQQERFGPAPADVTVRLVTDSLGRRVVRGGSFRYAAADVLSQPVRTSQATRADDIGFRVVVGSPVGTGDSARPN